MSAQFGFGHHAAPKGPRPSLPFPPTSMFPTSAQSAAAQSSLQAGGGAPHAASQLQAVSSPAIMASQISGVVAPPETAPAVPVNTAMNENVNPTPMSVFLRNYGTANPGASAVPSGNQFLHPNFLRSSAAPIVPAGRAPLLYYGPSGDGEFAPPPPPPQRVLKAGQRYMQAREPLQAKLPQVIAPASMSNNGDEDINRNNGVLHHDATDLNHAPSLTDVRGLREYIDRVPRSTVDPEAAIKLIETKAREALNNMRSLEEHVHHQLHGQQAAFAPPRSPRFEAARNAEFEEERARAMGISPRLLHGFYLHGRLEEVN